MKWDRDVLGGHYFYGRKSVPVGARRVWRLTVREVVFPEAFDVLQQDMLLTHDQAHDSD